MLVISSEVFSVPMPSLVLPDSLLGMSALLVRMCLLVSVFFSVPLNRSGGLMKLWDISGDGKLWKVQSDIRDLGDHLDFTRRARAGTLSNRVREAAVGALPLGFQVHLGLVRGKYTPAGLHAAEASYVSSSSLSAWLLLGQFGPVKGFLQALWRFLTCLMGQWVLILRSILFGLGFA